MRRYLWPSLAASVMMLSGCRPSESIDSAPGDGSAGPAVEAAEDGRGVSLWVGLHCSVLGEGSGERAREFSFYVDGAEVQRWESPCVGYAAPGEQPPNGGQFSVPLEPGIHVLRFQDDTGDSFGEERVQVSRDAWVFVHHRVLEAGGYMLSFDVRSSEPRYVAD